jgi:hypothetical protein
MSAGTGFCILGRGELGYTKIQTMANNMTFLCSSLHVGYQSSKRQDYRHSPGSKLTPKIFTEYYVQTNSVSFLGMRIQNK